LPINRGLKQGVRIQNSTIIRI